MTDLPEGVTRLNTLLLLTILSGWSYEGFCSEPGEVQAASSAYEPPEDRPRPIPAPSPVPAPPAPSLPVVPPAEPQPPSETRANPPAVPPVVNAVIPPPAPTVWQLADAKGQVWKHTDATWLRRWVESRNRAMRTVNVSAVPTFAPRYAAQSYCTGNRCYRGR